MTDHRLLDAQGLNAAADELARARAKFPRFNSAHEGYMVILEEMEELKAWVFMNQGRRSLSQMRGEAIQVAAMAVRFASDCCEEK